MATNKIPRTLYGTFSDAPFISSDPLQDKTDPYIKTEPLPSRYLGKSLTTNVAPGGRLPNTFFGKSYLTLASKEQNGGKDIDVYENPGKLEVRQRQEAKKKNIVEKDFKVASFPKHSTGPGSFVGTFQGKAFEHQAEYKVLTKEEVPSRPKPQPTNVKTNPPKKGTYGVVGTLLEKPEKYDPNRKGDEFDALRKKERAQWEESKKKNLGGVFKLTGLGKKLFDQKGQTGVSSIFDHYEPKEEKKKKKPAAEAKKGTELELKPFKYTNGTRVGREGFFNKFPNNRGDNPAPDPYDSVKLKRKEEREKAPKPLQGTWKPVQHAKKGVVSSLLRRFY